MSYIRWAVLQMKPQVEKLTPWWPDFTHNMSCCNSENWPQRNGNIQTLELKTAAAAAAKSLQSCPTVRPHRRQPTRLPHPWDSPGKNTGVGCHFLLQCMKVKSEREVAQSCLTLCNPMDCSLSGFSVYGIFQARVLEWGAIVFSAFHLVELIIWML